MSSEMFTEMERGEIEAVKIAIKKRLRILMTDLPNDYAQLFRNGILTGGAVASLFHGEDPNDWDIYLETHRISTQFLERVMKNINNIEDCIADINPNYNVTTLMSGKVVTENAITFKNRLQVITRSDRTARDTFDFLHCMPYFEFGSGNLFISRAQYDAIKQHKLVQNPKFKDQPNLGRLQKLVARGWKTDLMI